MLDLRHAIRNGVVLDTETHPILPRPQFPPKPVGLAIRWPHGHGSEYYAFGHPAENNIDEVGARKSLLSLWESDTPLIFHNAKFDLQVLTEHWDLPWPDWWRVHDTMWLAFLTDPHNRNHSLKGLAEDHLDWEPEEQDEVAEYVWENRKELTQRYGGKVSRSKSGPHSAGAWIWACPGALIGRYAIGDVDRTYGLLEYMLPQVVSWGMSDAYEREQQILPIFAENEKQGIRVDLEALKKDIPDYQKSMERADAYIRAVLQESELNVDSNADLAEALQKSKMVRDEDWTLTPTGKLSVSKDNLQPEMIQDPQLAKILFYRNRLQTSLSTFLVPWLSQASERNGTVSTNWNQTRGQAGGTRTGRPSTYAPNFLNIPKRFRPDTETGFSLAFDEDNQYGLKPLPNVRYYVMADEGDVILHRDFSSQEMRIFADVEQWKLFEAYCEDKNVDTHSLIGHRMAEIMGFDYDEKRDRGNAKILNFQALYGGGVPAAAKKLNCSHSEAKEYKRFHDEALPGRKLVNEVIKEIAADGIPMKTWGGRLYFPEPPTIKNGRVYNFLYKMINYYCQGSAADITKQSLIDWYGHPKREARFLISVYDENNVSAPKQIWREQMSVLRECMEQDFLEIPMLSDGKYGVRWGQLKECR